MKIYIGNSYVQHEAYIVHTRPRRFKRKYRIITLNPRYNTREEDLKFAVPFSKEITTDPLFPPQLKLTPHWGKEKQYQEFLNITYMQRCIERVIQQKLFERTRLPILIEQDTEVLFY